MIMSEVRGIHHASPVAARNHIPGPRSGQTADSALQGRVLTTKVGLYISTNLSFDEWELAGRRISGIVDSSCWWLGDWLVYGKNQYADRYQRGIEAVGLQYQTLRNYAWVARRFPFSRRRSGLTFQHHSEIASLLPAEQDEWLDRAEQGKWTTKQLRTALQLARRGPADAPGPAGTEAGTAAEIETVRKLAVPVSRVEWWRKAAEQSGTAFEQWVLSTLDQAAESILDIGTPAAITA
jgi:hypothetical protein